MLTDLADCLQDNRQIHTEAGDITLTIISLAFLDAGGWQLLHSRYH